MIVRGWYRLNMYLTKNKRRRKTSVSFTSYVIKYLCYLTKAFTTVFSTFIIYKPEFKGI